MKTITFIRHAQTEANAGGISRPNAEIILTKEGEQQAQQLVDHWQHKPTNIYISEFKRTAQTATYLANKFNLTPIKITALNEFNPLGFELIKGLTGAQRKPLTTQYWETADPNARQGDTGQTFNEFCTQITNFIPTLHTLENNSVIIGHGMWLALFTWLIREHGNKIATTHEMRQFYIFNQSLNINNLHKAHITVLNKKMTIHLNGHPPEK